MTTFPCPACGGLADPLPGASRMPCSYCGTQLTIPENLRTAKQRIESEKIAQPRLDPRIEPPPYQMPDMDMRDILTTAAPIAAEAMNVGGLWYRIRRWGWGCLAGIIILCLMTCALLFLLLMFIRENS